MNFPGELAGLPTYRAGLAQAQAYRNLKKYLVNRLKKHELTMLDWATLGLIYEKSGSQYRPAELAEELNVRPPLVTVVLKRLRDKGLVRYKTDRDDNRSKLLVLTAKGSELVQKLELNLRQDMKSWLAEVAPSELVGYLVVLYKIARLDPK